MITPTASQTQSTDVNTLGGPTVNSSQIPPQAPFTPTPPPDLSTIIAQNTQTSPAEDQLSSVSDQIDSLTGQLASQGDYANGLNAKYNVDQNTQLANDLTSNISQIQAQRDSLFQQYSSANKNYGLGAYLDFQTKMTDGELSAKQAAYSATLATVNGQLSTAKGLIDTAIKNKYDPIVNQINAFKSQADLISSTLNRDQTKQLAVMQAQLADRTAQIATNKAISTTMLEKIATAAANSANPAPAYIVAQAQNAALGDNPSSALSIISPYLNDPLAAKQELADIQAKNASAAASYASANKDNQQADLYKSQAAAYGSPALIAAVQNGTIDPSKVNSRNLSIMAAFANAGVNVNQGSIDAAAAKKVITNLQVQSAQITQAGGALERNLPLLASLSDKVNTLGIPAADTNLNALESKFSNQPDIVNYLSTLSTVRAEYAKYISRGAAVDDATKTEAANAIPVGVNGDTLRSLLGVIQTEGKNVQSSITDAQKNEWSQLQGGASSSVPAAGTTGTLSDGTVVTVNGDGSITDAKGNKYDQDGNKL